MRMDDLVSDWEDVRLAMRSVDGAQKALLEMQGFQDARGGLEPLVAATPTPARLGFIRQQERVATSQR